MSAANEGRLQRLVGRLCDYGGTDMICSKCGGAVLWMGPFSALTHTECQVCGARNSQIVQDEHECETCEGEGTIDERLDGYWCVVCGRHIPADENGVIVHDDVPHPEEMTFDEEERPQ